ncbi:hypothetical protein GCM10017673_46960 [Streptosporangium violaceochromogenes]|nr:hypothetical protein GCM10017673_46960 [Streptosporangium violaceochromogenes]
MHFLVGRRGHAVALVTGVTCCLVVSTGLPADARPRYHGPSTHEVAEARSKAVERSKQVSAATVLLARARVRLEELTAQAAKLAGAEATRLEGAVGLEGAAKDTGDMAAAEAAESRGAAPAAENAEGAARSSAAGPAIVRASAVRPVGTPGPAAPPAAAEGAPGGVVAETSGTRGAAERARAAVVGQAAEVRRLQGERDRLQREAEAARSAADRLADDRETARERFRVARDRLRYGGYRAAAMSRLRARVLVARGARAPSWALAKSSGSGRGDVAADWALTQIDKPYVWAGSGPRSYDCSGLTMRAWGRAGVKMPHWTGTQWTSGRHVRLDRLRRGDLLFFGRRTRDPRDIRHVGLYIGRNLMVHAPRTGDVVRVAPMWRGDLIGATRPV